MSIVSFDDFKKKKQRSSAYNSRGGLRNDIALKEEQGYDLCVFLSEERSAPDSDPNRVESLMAELKALIASLPHEHAWHYFMAFLAYWEKDCDEMIRHFDAYLASEKELYTHVAECDWWIDSLVWVFIPPLPGMYGRLSELFFKHWPLCAMGWVMEALEVSESGEENLEQELDLLMMAITADPQCYLAHYLCATIYYDLKLWDTALPYFEKASQSAMYSQDPAFYFDYAWACDKAGKLDLATRLYHSCLSLDGSYPSVINNLGCILMRKDQPAEALSYFTRALKLGLDGTLPYKNTVSALEKLGRYEEAIDFIRQNTAILGHRYELELPRLELLAKAGGTQSPLPVMETGGTAEPSPFTRQMIITELERRVKSTGELFGIKCRVYEGTNGYGREYYIPGAGRIDLLLKTDSGYLVVAAALPESEEHSLLKLLRQGALVRSSVARRLETVGVVLVCAAEPKPTTLALKNAFVDEDAAIYRIGFSLTEYTQ